MDELLELLALLARLTELDDAEHARLDELLASVVTADSEAITAASDEQLAELEAGLSAVFDAERASDAPNLDRLRAIADEGGFVDVVRAEDARRDEASAAAQAEVERLTERIAASDTPPEGDPADPDPAADPADPLPADPDAGADPPAGGDPADPPADPAEVDPEREPVGATTAAGAPARRAPLGRIRRGVPAERRPAIGAQARAGRIVGPNGRELSTATEIADALTDAMERQLGVQSGYRELVPVVSIHANFPEERRLTRDRERNFQLIDAVVNQEAITAAGGLCAPLEPYYGVAQIATNGRRVPGGMARFQMDRGGITWITPPSLADVTAGVTTWTLDDDVAADPDDADTPRKPVVVVDCGAEQTARIRAIVTAVQFGNIGAMTYPERVRAITELLQAAGARHGDTELLDEIKAGSVKSSTGAALGAARDLLYAVGVATAQYRNEYRMDPEARLRVQMPAWAMDMVREDIARSLPATMDQLAVARDAIRGFFTARGINLTEYIDSSSDGNQLFPGQSDDGTLLDFPAAVEWALYHEGGWLHGDMGRLDLGIVRDSTLNSTNDYQLFMETFETSAYVGVSRGSRWITSEVCPNGASAGTVDPAALCAGQYVPSV